MVPTNGELAWIAQRLRRIAGGIEEPAPWVDFIVDDQTARGIYRLIRAACKRGTFADVRFEEFRAFFLPKLGGLTAVTAGLNWLSDAADDLGVEFCKFRRDPVPLFAYLQGNALTRIRFERSKFQAGLNDLADVIETVGQTNAKPNPSISDDSAFVAEKTLGKRQDEPAVELKVDLASQRATLLTAKGTDEFDLPSGYVARWLKVLADHPLEWFLPEKYKQHDEELDGIKPTDKLRSLRTWKKGKCKKLSNLIEPSTRSGMRFNPSWPEEKRRALLCADN